MNPETLQLITIGIWSMIPIGMAIILTWAITSQKLRDRRELREYISEPIEFVVDITKPPIFPPNIEMWNGAVETSRSKARREAYDEYSEAYDKALEAR